VGYLSGLTALIGDGIPYHFADAYGGSQVRLGRHLWEITGFATHDNYGDQGRGSGMDWTNLLLGSRLRVLDNATMAVDVSGSLNRFRLSGSGIEVSGNRLDLRNELSRASVAADAHVTAGRTRWRAGLELTRRALHSHASATVDSTSIFASDVELTEASPYSEISLLLPFGIFTAGVRLDAAAGSRAWQPRASIVLRPSGTVAISGSVARTGRLVQEVTDPEPEPGLAFYDLWLRGGSAGVPLPQVDHASVEADVQLGRTSLHVGGFLSKGHGLGEVLPPWQQTGGPALMRFGDARARGLEARLSRRSMNGTSGWAASYALTAAERRWTDRWVPWRLDRRHELRVTADTRVGARWAIYGAGALASGVPLTPVTEVVWPDGTVLGFEGRPVLPAYRFASEGTDRGGATAHVDIGITYHFHGPWQSEASLAISVTNVTFAPTAPLVPVPREELVGANGSIHSSVTYERAFDVPAVPSAQLSILF
jgi:hypothetical protein